MGKRSSLGAVQALDRMVAASGTQCLFAPEDLPLLHRFLRELRRTGKPDVSNLGLIGNWHTNAEKHPGRAMILAMAKDGMGPTAIRQTLVLSPHLFPGMRIPKRRTISTWISTAENSDFIGQKNPISSKDEHDDPKNS